MDVVEKKETVTAAIYSRVSSDEQRIGQNIKSQIYEVEKFCKDQGFQIFDRSDRFKDDGWSGGFDVNERPAIYELLEVAKEKKFNAVACYSVDRLARDVGIFKGAMKQLAAYGIKIYFVKNQADDTPSGRLTLNVHASFAEYEHDVILERLQRGRMFKVRVNKQFIGAIPSYGYNYIHRDKSKGEGGHYEINEEATVVKMVFRWVGLEGISARDVVRELTRMGIPTRKRLPKWSKSSVLRMLKNENYIGRFWYNKRKCVPSSRSRAVRQFRQNKNTGRVIRPREEWLLVEYPDLRLVDDTVFASVQERLKNNRVYSPRNAKAKYLLSGGMLRCEKCSSSYYGTSTHGLPFYKDGNKAKQFPLPKTCDSPSISAKKIEPLIWDTLVEVFSSPKFLIGQLEKNRGLLDDRGDAEFKAKLEILNNRLQSIDAEEKRLILGFQKGILGEESVKEPMDRLSQDRAAILKEVEGLRAENARSLSGPGIEKDVKTLSRRIAAVMKTLDFDAKKQILQLLVKEILFNGKRIRVRGYIPINTGGAATDANEGKERKPLLDKGKTKNHKITNIMVEDYALLLRR